MKRNKSCEVKGKQDETEKYMEECKSPFISGCGNFEELKTVKKTVKNSHASRSFDCTKKRQGTTHLKYVKDIK